MTENIFLFWGGTLLQLLVATLCGGFIGYQRETTDRPAGFRTHILVCVGSAIYMLVSKAVAGEAYDPGRIAAQVASGIGFLGAGTIIKQGSIVRGLTTAASLWAVAGIGLAAGYGGEATGIALLGTIVVFLALSLLRQIEARFERGHMIFLVDLSLTQPRLQVEWVQQVLASHSIGLNSITLNEGKGETGEISIEGRAPSREEAEQAIGELMKGTGILSVRQRFR